MNTQTHKNTHARTDTQRDYAMSLPACDVKAGMHQAEEQQKSAVNEWECQAATGFSPEDHV